MRARGFCLSSGLAIIVTDELRDVFPSAKDWAFCLVLRCRKYPSPCRWQRRVTVR